MQTLEVLNPLEFDRFKLVLRHTETMKDHSRIPRHEMGKADRVEIVELMVDIYGQQSVEVICGVLQNMNRRDVVQRLRDISSGSKGKLWKKKILLYQKCGMFTLMCLFFINSI